MITVSNNKNFVTSDNNDILAHKENNLNNREETNVYFEIEETTLSAQQLKRPKIMPNRIIASSKSDVCFSQWLRKLWFL